jgi:SAM-dependent methyltransferase
MFSKTAHVYDLIYEASGKDYAAESSVVHRLIQERNSEARSLLDVACGTGGHLRHLQRWYTVTGTDLDPAMLDEARTHLPAAALVEADMRTLRLPATFDAVTCLFSSVGYLRDTGELGAAMAAMARHLNPGGVLVVDGWVRPDAWREGGASHVEVAERGDLKVVRVGRSRRHGDTTLLEMHHLIADDTGIEHVVDRHELRLFSPVEYENALRGAGLVVEVVDSPMEGRDRYLGIRKRQG